MKFKDYQISTKLKQELDRLALVKPTDIQFKSIRHILEGEDVFAVAYTGTGKTAAFVIPILELIQRRGKKEKGVQAIVLVPTRELALQISGVFDEIGRGLWVRTVCIHGGVDQEGQKELLDQGAQVVVTTPGRMFDLVAQGTLSLKQVKHLVLDEADLMLDMGFRKDVEDLVKKLPARRQNLFFSATINKKIKSFAYQIVRDAIRIQLSPKNPVAKTIDHAVAFIEMDDKRFFLENILKEYEESRFLVFVRTKVRAERVVKAMERVHVETRFLHGGLDQKERLEILDAFRENRIRVLITTDVAARGIDIPNVEYVINYDLPEYPENYVHRVGRTGRGKQRGQALSFCAESELELLEEIEDYTGEEIVRYELDKQSYREILFDSEEDGDDWQKLLRDANKEDGTEENW
ncbi:MAG: DEAD/DEAH box helicase [Bacteroidetes bacterium]|nr:MAG: DEAD/DEAH box helicase [Bacteroidota bacterium]